MAYARAPMESAADRSPNLLAWQWKLYANNHTDRRNLLLHIFTVPLFWLSTISLVVAPLAGQPWGALGGVVTMAIVMALQGRTHALEATAPIPFNGPFDVAARIFAEQWITFPRFVMSGAFAHAWRERAS